jgi:transcription antitermination protein NusB
MRRSDQRRAAVFAVYQREVRGGGSVDEALATATPFTRDLVDGVERHRAELDDEIGRLAQGWELDRIAALEKSIMLVCLYELHHRDDIPAPVAIDEAVELAKRYCGAEAPGFVNGILAAAARAQSR